VPAAAIDHDDDAPNRLVPVCAEHAEGRVLPPAGPVEDRLLATYLVEMVPDESVARIYADREVERQRVRIRHRRTAIALAALTIALVGTFVWVSVRSSPVRPPRSRRRSMQVPRCRTTCSFRSSAAGTGWSRLRGCGSCY
jgi:hypothetical protein